MYMHLETISSFNAEPQTIEVSPEEVMNLCEPRLKSGLNL